MARHALRRRSVLLLLAAAFAFSPALGTRAEETPRLASAEARELWIKGSDQILAGDFKSGAKTIEKIESAEPGHRGVRSALAWLKELEDLEKSRDGFRQAMYDYYVGKALEAAKEAREGKPADADDDASDGEPAQAEPEKETDLKEGETGREADAEEPEGGVDSYDDDDLRYKWSKALFYAQSAMLNARSEDDFRAEKWLPEIVDNVLAEIERHKSEGEWRDALTLYDVLHRLFPDTKEYKDGFDFCSKRAHLEFVYGGEKKSKNADEDEGESSERKLTWRSDLDGVSPDALREILARIDDDYVESPEFRKLCREGIEHLLILAKSDSLAQTFPTLAEKDLVAEFVTRLEAQLKREVEVGRRFGDSSLARVFDKILDANADTIRLPEEVIVDEFVAGLLEPLDEFTSVIWPTEVSEFNKQTRGEFVGVGIQITQELGKPVRVESPLEDSPAYRAGVKPGDHILKVEGKSTEKMTITEAVKNITGEPGSTVVLTIEDGVTKKVRDIELVRERISIRTVRGDTRDDSKPTGWDYMIDDDLKIGYIRVSGFMDKTVPDLEKALTQLDDEKCRGLILDLRFNPGGLLNAARDMCDLFLSDEDPIVRTKGRDRGQNMVLRASGKRNRHHRVPMIILVNEYSASASEIVAGALAGLKEACIVGTRTFGKGSVQNLIPILDAQAYLKLTTAHYYVPDADMAGDDQWYCLHKKEDSKSWGVEPHIVVNTIPQETAKILRLRRERDVLKGRGQTGDIPKEVLERRSSSQPAEKFPEDPNPTMDPQLITATSLMRMKLMSDQPWALAPRLQRTAVSVAKIPKPSEPQDKQ